MYTELNHFLLLLLLFFNLFYFLFFPIAMYMRMKIFRKNCTFSFFSLEQREKDLYNKIDKVLFEVREFSRVPAFSPSRVLLMLSHNGWVPLFSFRVKQKLCSFIFQKKNLGVFTKFGVFTKKRTWILQKQTSLSNHSLEHSIKKSTILIHHEGLKKKLYWLYSLFFLLFTCCLYGTVSNFICSDFTIYNIFTNSTADVPTFYKISATWSNHEGSLLLWCWLLSFTCFLFCISICENSLFKVTSFCATKE